jgi:hypothetical protein
MGLAGIDHGLELGVGQQAIAQTSRAVSGGRLGLGGATEAMAADCTSLVGCACAPGIRIDCNPYSS